VKNIDAYDRLQGLKVMKEQNICVGLSFLTTWSL